MNHEIRLVGHPSARSFDFTIHTDEGVIPATFWNAAPPLRPRPRPPVTLLQHGGPFHKRHQRSESLAETLVERAGCAVLLIDGPIHGLRRSDDPGIEAMLANFERHWRDKPGIDGFVLDWKTALDAVIGRGWIDPHRIAWFGMSMGTAYGIPLCAEETRIRAAAFGMWGTDWGHEATLVDYARRLKTPVLFQVKEQDEFFSTSGQRKLFDSLSSPQKCLHTFPGGHSLTAPGQLDQLLDFIRHSFATAVEGDADAEPAREIEA